MREIVAIIQPFMLRKVMDELHSLPHFPGVTVSDVRGQGRGRGAGGAFKITEDSIDYHVKVRMEIFCADEHVDDIVKAIINSARTGNPGDGLVTVSELDRIVRIRSGEIQERAV